MNRRVVKYILTMFVMCLMLIKSGQVEAASNTPYKGYKEVNVLDYGADKKGKKDSSDAVKKAVAEVKNLSEQAEKAYVYFPSGTYKLSNCVSIRGINVKMFAEKDAKVIASQGAFNVQIGGKLEVYGGVWSAASKSEKVLFFGNNNAEIYLRKGTITDAYRAVTVNTGTVRLNNMKIKKIRAIGVAVFKKSKLEVKYSKFDKACLGIIVSCSTGTIEGSKITGSKNMGMEAIEKSTVTVKKCEIYNNGSGYQPKKTEYKGHGIGVYTGSNVSIYDCKITANDQCGISCNGGDVNVYDTLIEKNGRHGIGTREKCTIKMNRCVVNKNGYNKEENSKGWNGMILVDGSFATIRNSKITNNSDMGIWADGKGATIYAQKTLFKGNKNYQVQMSSREGYVKYTSDSCRYEDGSHGVFFLVYNIAKVKLIKKGKNVFKNTGDTFVVY